MNSTPQVENGNAERQSQLQILCKADGKQNLAAGIQQLYDCSSANANCVADVLSITSLPHKNPTLDIFVQTMLAGLAGAESPDLWISQCIAKKPEVRLNKIDYFCKPAAERPANVSLQEGVVLDLEAKKWEEIRQISNATSFKIRLLIGDQDFFTLDALDEWASAETVFAIEQELSIFTESIRQRASEFFGPAVIVDRWSALYSKNDCISEYENAKNSKDTWLTGKFRRASERPYLQSWGYPAIAAGKNIPEPVLRQFIEDDIIRTAAQYRVESNIIKERKAIQCWAETCGDPIWPITLSNYDQKGSPPSISLL